MPLFAHPHRNGEKGGANIVKKRRKDLLIARAVILRRPGTGQG